jgi:hypothetical protein
MDALLILDIARQRTECAGPKLTIVTQPTFDCFERPRLQRTEVHSSIDGTFNQVGAFYGLVSGFSLGGSTSGFARSGLTERPATMRFLILRNRFTRKLFFKRAASASTKR